MKELLLVFTILSDNPENFKVDLQGELVDNCKKVIAQRFEGKEDKSQKFALCASDFFTNMQDFAPYKEQGETPDEEDLNPDLMPLR